MGSSPIISVCIPCYNGEDFIAGTLESVLQQSLSDFELIVIDDASTDRTVSIVEGFRDPRIKLYKNAHNLGMGQNWNKAVSIVRGKYVKLLCGDDLLSPQCLARQVTALESVANTRAVLAICNRTVIDGAGKVVFKRPFPFVAGLVNGIKLIRRCIRLGSNVIGEPAVGLFRRDLLEKNLTYDASNPYLIDLRFWADLLRHGDAFIDAEYLAAFRISDTAVSARVGYRQSALFRSFVRNLRKDPFYRIGWVDMALGYGLSFQWCILRNFFLLLHASRRPHKTPGDICFPSGVHRQASDVSNEKPNTVSSDQRDQQGEQFAKSQVPC
jgi:glycosyltransferase involved in cell wall biosynthesis